MCPNRIFYIVQYSDAHATPQTQTFTEQSKCSKYTNGFLNGSVDSVSAFVRPLLCAMCAVSDQSTIGKKWSKHFRRFWFVVSRIPIDIYMHAWQIYRACTAAAPPHRHYM